MCCVRTEALALLRHNHLFSFLLDPVDVSSLNVGGEGADWNFIGGTGLPTLASDRWGTESLSKRPTCFGTRRARTNLIIYSFLFYHIDIHEGEPNENLNL